MRFAVHEPPPAGSLAERARSLHARAGEILRQGAERLFLVGHSTGGLDARLLAHPLYQALPARAALIARIAAVVTLSAPLHGTPLARRLGRGAWAAMPALWFASILASRGRLRMAGQLGALWNLVKTVTLQKPSPTDALIAELADVDDETAHQIRRFLGEVARDHRLVEDLSPETMAELNRRFSGPDPVPLHSFVSVGPPPFLGPLAFLRAPLQRVLYDLTYRLASSPPAEGSRTPSGPWIGASRTSLNPDSSDGIVPAWSQTVAGVAEGIVLGDHLDVIGHYESRNATFLSSGSRFDDARFRSLWQSIGRSLHS
jgi:hypothetical protein